MRETLVAWIRGRPLFLRYKMLKRLSLLEEITGTLATAGIPHGVTGGFAYDALRGGLTRYHADVDFSLLGEHADEAFVALRHQGLRVTRVEAHKAVVRRGALHADLFLWMDVGGGTVEMMVLVDDEYIVVRIPRDFVTAVRPAQLMGVRFPITSAQYMVSILPLVGREEDRAFIARLETPVALAFDESAGRMEVTTRRFEFRGANPSPLIAEPHR